MTEKELFENWKKEQYKDQSTKEKMEYVEHLHVFPEYFEKAYLAGLHEGQPKWHKVADGDLPKDNQKCFFLRSNTYDENYKIIFKESCISVLVGCYSFYLDEEGYNTTKHCFYDENGDDEIDIKKVYAWQEIELPQFKE